MSSSRTVFDRYVAANGDRSEATAFTFISGDARSSWTYEALFAEAVRIGKLQLECWEKSGGAGNGLVAILATSQEQQTLQVLGALSAGLVPAVLTPPNRKLNPEYYVETTRSVLKAVAPTLLVTELNIETFAASGSYGVATLEGQLLRSSTGDRLKVPNDSAFVQFSSGTTGIKKGVAVSAEALFAQLDSYATALELTANDCIANWLPLYHDMGYITSLHLALSAGVHSVMLDPVEWVSNPAIYPQIVEEFEATHSWHPNFAFAFMAARVRPDITSSLATLRHVVNCSEPVTSAAQAAFIKRFESNDFAPEAMTGCYAMAETTFAVTHGIDTSCENLDKTGPSELGTLESRLPIPSVGKLIDGVVVEIRDVANQTVPDRTIGEIWISAPFLALTYLGTEAPEGSAFADGWYQSGDLGYFVDGNLYVTGRKKDLIIVAGHNVFPEDLERTIGDSDGVKPGRVAVFAEFDERMQTERVTALAESDGETPVDVISLRQHLMADFSVAVTVHLVEPGWLIKSSSGKISRAKSSEKWANPPAEAPSDVQ